MEKDIVMLKPVMSLKSHVSYVKDVEPGVQVSYGGTYTTDHVTKMATIPVGYADGYPRMLSNKGWVLIHGKKSADLWQSLYGSVYGRCDRNPGCKDRG